MKVRRQADIQNIDRRVGQNIVQVSGEPGAIFIGKAASARRVKIADAVDGEAVRKGGVATGMLRPDSGPDDADPMHGRPYASRDSAMAWASMARRMAVKV
mgnify:CR=1 FL=1